MAVIDRHRVKVFDAGLVTILLAAAALFALEADVFAHESSLIRHQGSIELNELLALMTLLMICILGYSWRRAREHSRENGLRLAAEQEVMALALQDPLTGLPNRRQFDEALEAALSKVPVAPEAHAVLLLDLNGFKKVNDVHGHQTGDQLLIHVGARLLRAVRDGDLVARLGGDEFAVIAANVAGAPGATSIALRIIESLAAPISIGTINHPIGTAIGIALAPQDAIGAEELLRKADVALYRAKTERASAVRFFEPEMDARLHERDELERSLRAGLDGKAFTLRFQPIVDPEGRIVSFEAIPRWELPGMGDVDGERFLPVAEEMGVLPILVEQLLRQACLAANLWSSRVRLSFNLPGALITDAAFGLRILIVLGETGLSPDRLSLEIDEGALFRDAELAGAVLAPLRRAGVSIIADHFGTGYSDLKNFRKLQLDGVKIDASFVGTMGHDRQAAVLVKAMIGIAHGMDLTLAADGVATEEQRAALHACGCDRVQGDLYGSDLTIEGAVSGSARCDRASRSY